MATVARIAVDTHEWRIRCELAAAFRLAALFGWDNHVATHMSARLPDGSFLLNPFGLLFEEITASCLMRMDLAGTIIDTREGLMLNQAAFGVHGAILEARPDINCVMQFHAHDGVAVSVMAEGLLPLCQNALTIWRDIAYHDYEGMVSPAREKELLQRDLGTHHLMTLRNHGTLAAGRSIASAFYRIYELEWSCTAQVRALSTGRATGPPAPKDHSVSIGPRRLRSPYRRSHPVVGFRLRPGSMRPIGKRGRMATIAGNGAGRAIPDRA